MATKKPAEPQQNKLTYAALADAIFHLNGEYGDLGMNAIWGAWTAAGGTAFLQYPWIQNQRVKGINTQPADYSKDELAKMVLNPGSYEKELRAASASLASSTKTYDLIPQTYQDMMSYYWYVAPGYTPNKVPKETKMRDLHLGEQIVRSIDPKRMGHEIVGKCVQYGKVFYTPRISVDKSHNKVNFAFLQQLPEDFCKIVGFNNGPGKYTVAFDLMYFMRPGTDWRQFGDLFEPYMNVFAQVVERKTKSKYVYASVNVDRFNKIKAAESIGAPEWEKIGSVWAYWVTLPAESVITFEISDRNDYVAPPTTGLMVSMTQIPNYEAAQMEIVLNPLTSVMTGELETYDTKGVPNADPIAVGPGTRRLFESFWYEMLARNNTSGIGIYMAPAKNLKLQTISDTVSNTNIATTAVADQIQKAGLAALIPTTDDPKVGVAELSAKINAQYANIVYRTFERFFNNLFENLRLQTPLRFKMFGNIFDRDKEIEQARQGMTLGILGDTLKYAAIQGYTLLDDIAMSEFIEESGVLDKRIPLVSSYSAKQSESGLPPQAKQELNPGGRPAEEGSENGQKTEPLREDPRRDE